MQDGHGFIVIISNAQVVVFMALPKYSILSNKHDEETYLLDESSEGSWAGPSIMCLGLGYVVGSSTAGETNGRTAPRRTQGSSF